MTLTTHAIVGAAAATLFPQQPVLAFAVAFASHFAIDALPHWDYNILSKKKNDENRLEEHFNIKSRAFALDLTRIGSDAILGTILAVAIFSFWLFDFPIWLAVLGAWAGILPDPLQFIYYNTRFKFMEPLQRFHIYVQRGKSIYPPPLVGLAYQAILILALLGVCFAAGALLK
jgi:hypothetical protein